MRIIPGMKFIAKHPFDYLHRPGRTGHYGVTLRFYYWGKWHTRSLGCRFKNWREAERAAREDAFRRGWITLPGRSAD